MTTLSAWAATAEPPELPALEDDEDADVVVIGAGIAGLTTAYLLARDGRSVVLVDQDRPGRGMTGQTTAHLTAIQDRRFVQLEKKHGRETAIAVGQSHLAAVDLIDRITQEHKIPCDGARLDAYLMDTNGQLKGNQLVAEMNLLHEIGLEGTEPVREGEAPILSNTQGLRVPHQARMHALHYLHGLLKAAKDKGVRAYGRTHVKKVDDGKVLVDGGQTITARATVIATHTPLAAKELALKLSPHTTYVVAAPVTRGTLPDALYYDTESPYHYVRLQPWNDDQDLIIVGGADHRTGSPPSGGHDESFRSLETWARKNIPGFGDVELRWTGQVFDSADGVAYIGRSPDHKGETYVATGFSGNGTTHGTLAGMILADLIGGRHSPWAETYDPARKKGLATVESLRHNLNAAKHLIVDRVRNQGPDDVSQLAAGEGAVITRGTQHHAVYRHTDGRLEEHSAVCTHMGCIVHWNQNDATFECPCHGSRFGMDGRVLSGPAVAPLKPIEEEKKAEHKR